MRSFRTRETCQGSQISIITESVKPLSSPFANSQWIWPESHNWDIHNSYALFRKPFTLTTVPPRAPLFITADQSYQLYVNGQYVNRGPARGFQSHWPYDEVDVRAYLKPGKNLLAIRAYNPGFSNFQYLTEGYAGILVAAKWGKTEIRSDRSWKCRRQTGINRATVPTSLQLFSQEHIDLRIEDPNWMQPEFEDGAWSAEPATAPWNGMPWNTLEARGIPLLEEVKWTEPVQGIGVAKGKCAPGYAETINAAVFRFGEGLTHQPKAFTAEEIAVKPTKSGHFRSYLLDFGKTVIGSFAFEILGARGGEIVETLHGETVDEATLAMDYKPGSHCRMAFAHRLTCRRGDQSHAFYHAFGFRYVIVTVRDAKKGLTLRPSLRTAYYPLKKEGHLASSDPVWESIWKISAWTQRVCSLDAYVDTPWREQAQWWGDARVQAKNTFFYSGDTRLFRRGIAQIAAQPLPNGLTYGHAPTMAHSCILPDFSLIWLITLHDFYWQTGSTEAYETHRETVAGILGYFERLTCPRTGLVENDPRYWLFLDWTDVFKDGYPTLLNLWLLIALQRMAELATQSGDLPEAKRLQAWAGRLRRAIGQLETPEGLLRDGLKRDGTVVAETSIHSQTLAVLAGLQPKNDAARFEKILRPFLRGETKPKTQPSSYWITYLFEVATEAGYGAEVLECIRKKWLPMIAYGSTWEGFEKGCADASCSHAWSAHPLYHLMQTLGGIRQTAAGWREICYQPTFQGDHAEVIVPTPLGNIVSQWKRQAGKITADLALPKGITAQVRLPHHKEVAVTGKQRFMVKTE